MRGVLLVLLFSVTAYGKHILKTANIHAECPTDNTEKLMEHELCNKYYQCSFGRAIEMPCPGGLVFSLPQEKCDWPENVECGNRITSYSKTAYRNLSDNKLNVVDIFDFEQDEELHEGNDELDTDTTLEENEQDSTDNQAGNEAVVPDVPEENDVIVPDTGDTEHVQDVGIIEETPLDGDDNDESDTEVEEVNPAAKPCKGEILPHEECNKFYLCSNGVRYAMDCPANLFYSTWRKACQWPHLVKCKGRIIPKRQEPNVMYL